MVQEKTMIPQFIAGWIVAVKTTGVKKQNSFGYYEELTAKDDVYRVMCYIFKEEFAPTDVRDWIRNHIDDFARAWLNGYTIKTES